MSYARIREPRPSGKSERNRFENWENLHILQRELATVDGSKNRAQFGDLSLQRFDMGKQLIIDCLLECHEHCEPRLVVGQLDVLPLEKIADLRHLNASKLHVTEREDHTVDHGSPSWWSVITPDSLARLSSLKPTAPAG
jgi:hypothetical protein